MTRRATDLTGLVETAAARWPDTTAWVFDQSGQSLTFTEVRDRARALASVLHHFGVASGDRVAVMLDNRPEFPLTWLACAYLGAALVPVNTNYRDLDAGHVINHSNASLVVTAPEFVPMLERLHIDTGAMKIVDVDSGELARAAAGGATGSEVVESNAKADSPANIQYTSGTTGKPKGCVLPQRYWTIIADGLVNGHPHLCSTDTLLTAQPFHYIDPQWNVASGLASGARLVVLDRFHPTTFWDKVREYGVTWFYCLGLMPSLLLKMPVSSRDQGHKVRAIHCSAIPPRLHESLEERWGTPWFEAFGMTESGADIRLGPDDHDEVVGTGCLGRALPHRSVRITDTEGAPVGEGETGELLLQGDGLMLGYHADPDATRQAFAGGWFHTGDLVREDAEGRIYYAGRLKDSIRRSGENIAAVEVEDALRTHSAVAMAAVVPVPDELRGEEIRAFIVTEPDHTAGTDLAVELEQFCRRHLAYFKVPRYWTFRAELPLTPSERVAKGSLRAEPIGADTFELDQGAARLR